LIEYPSFFPNPGPDAVHIEIIRQRRLILHQNGIGKVWMVHGGNETLDLYIINFDFLCYIV
jgi:hypothetical protein